MDAVAPSWYPDPQRDGMLRWWDGTRWTEHVQPARAAGKPVFGQEVTGGIGPVTWYGPNEQMTHAYPPVTDERYAGSPLAALLAEHSRSEGGDVQVAGEHQAALEAVYQLRAKGGVLGALAGIGEQLLVDAVSDALPAGARPAVATPGPDGIAPYGASNTVVWSPSGPAPAQDSGLGHPRPAVESPSTQAESPWTRSDAAQAGYQAASVAVRGAATVVGMLGLISSLGAAVLVMLIGVVIAFGGSTGDGPDWLIWMFPLIGAVGVVLTATRLASGVRASRTSRGS
ncbi:DUF2510 domain-containing protein [Cellulomonas terrae]|uniref:DUF2510 domain-containing protein n=1 Tax=Cellulomonas terrae TaxID=311234 RepID=A0A511JM51_9CELL|nr:DUF2510 domain-containing protein [Cellulomonas terrae]GEL99024.1 hypothetical protein CTE05_25710 [Cellulomonas terrae]